MKKEYDFSRSKGRKNPHANQLKKQITIRIGVDIIDYFKQLATETGVPLPEPRRPLPPRLRRPRTPPVIQVELGNWVSRGERTIKRTSIVILPAVIALWCNTAPPNASAGLIPGSVEDALIHSDLVIRGTLTAYTMEVGTFAEISPGSENGSASFPFTILDIKVAEAINGYCATQRISVAIAGSYPKGESPCSTCVVAPLGLSNDYTVGDEFVLCLTYSERIRGGMYYLPHDIGRFNGEGNEYACEADGSTISLDEMRASVSRATNLDGLIEKASLVVTGRITEIEREREARGPERSLVHIDVDELVAGTHSSKRLVMDVLTIGGGTSERWGNMPDLHAGEDWLLLLARDGEVFYPVAGSNAMFRIEGDRLLRNGRVAIEKTKTDMLRRIRDLAGWLRPTANPSEAGQARISEVSSCAEGYLVKWKQWVAEDPVYYELSGHEGSLESACLTKPYLYHRLHSEDIERYLQSTEPNPLPFASDTKYVFPVVDASGSHLGALQLVQNKRSDGNEILEGACEYIMTSTILRADDVVTREILQERRRQKLFDTAIHFVQFGRIDLPGCVIYLGGEGVRLKPFQLSRRASETFGQFGLSPMDRSNLEDCSGPIRQILSW